VNGSPLARLRESAGLGGGLGGRQGGGGSVAVFGLGPIGQMCCRIALHRGAAEVFGIDLVDERLELARRYGVQTIDAREQDDVPEALRSLTDGRGPDSVIDAVGMEAHGAPLGKLAQQLAGLLPDAIAERLIQQGGVDRLSVLHTTIDTVRRGGTISLSGVYGGSMDPMPMMDLFDKQVQLRMGQANVKRWIPELMPLVEDDADPLGVEDLATHKLPLDQAPHAYEIFQRKEEGAIKILLTP
jgi:threonine dehydrogenase-like Zn-dependent dehydrogenase